MKTTKTVFHIFDASAFDEELGLLNEMSEKGWQLADADMRWFSQKYVRDGSVVYRYAIDYQDLSVGEFSRYRAEFADQGWTFVTHRGNWYYFRKPADPALSEDEYLLYTDEPSFRDMKRSVNLKVNLSVIFLLPSLLLIGPCMSAFLETAALLLVGLVSVLRCRRLGRVRCVPKKYRFHLWRYAWVPIILLLALSFVFIGARAGEARTTPPAVGVQSVTLTVKLPDVYAIWADFTASDAFDPEAPEPAAPEPDVSGAPYTVTNGEGAIIAAGVLSASENERMHRFLWPGRYTLTVDWGTEGDMTAYSAGFSYPAPVFDIPLWADFAWIAAWGAALYALSIVLKRKYGHAARF